MSDYNPAPMQNASHPYQKLGGWLLFWVVMAILAVFYSVVELFSNTGFLRNWQTYSGLEFWLQLLLLLCLLYEMIMDAVYAIMAIQRNPRFVLAWQLIYAGSIVNAPVQLTVHLLYGYPEGITFASDIWSFFVIALGLGLMTLYFARSVRVRTYMGSDEYLRLAFFTKKMKWAQPAVPDGE
ncbi:MAG: hypothetical protein FWE98_06370 [Oscillospiraceae bacterium]|nr:hypothetical protein [Oscillospiraceae bacterium]